MFSNNKIIFSNDLELSRNIVKYKIRKVCHNKLGITKIFNFPFKGAIVYPLVSKISKTKEPKYAETKGEKILADQHG
jgi:hypothetical protein